MKPSRLQEYQRFMSSEAWRKARLNILERDKYRCQICGYGDANGLKLQVHHNSYENLWECQPSNLITVCSDCHPIADQCQKRQRSRMSLTNQIRTNPSAFTAQVEASNFKVVTSRENAITNIDSSISRSIPHSDAFGANRRSAESLLKGAESYIE